MVFRNEPPLSPYEEIKKKNEQLQEFSKRLEESHNQYQSLTNTLPLIIFSINDNRELVYANKWLTQFTGKSVAELNRCKWKAVVHEEDYENFLLLFNSDASKETASMTIQCRLKGCVQTDYTWHMVAISPVKDEAGVFLSWTGYIVDIHAQKVYEQTLKDNKELKSIRDELTRSQHELEQNVRELNRSNRELEQFAFIASHDLQEPVRKSLFYSDYILTKYSDALDSKGKDYLVQLTVASTRMRTLIQDLLSFSKVQEQNFTFTRTDLNIVMKSVISDFDLEIKSKAAKVEFSELPFIECDASMMERLFANFLSNALKYSKEELPPVIKVTCEVNRDKVKISFSDNGIGFDEKYVPQMFTLFQRLHSKEEYEGTGLGLAICRKIASIHHGSIEAFGKPNEGATFVVTLPVKQNTFADGAE
jgi:PAS domain S-box-containing protein